jgi:signal transduction histidine kinase
MDTAEVYAPLRERLWLTVVWVLTLLVGSGATIGLLWRQQGARFYREQYEAAAALRASEIELKARNEELSRFTYSVSHDLKSPLVTIQTFVGYLEQDLSRHDAASVEKDFGFIRGAAQKMSRLLDELLELSRVGRTTNPPEDISLQAVVAEALTLVAGRVAERGVRVDVTAEPIVLRGDRVRLVEVFQNLLDNAVKFMGAQPSPRIEIAVESSGPELELVVADNGVGIDPRHMGKLFGLFEKLDPKSEGTGIGLALVRRIVEAHGGRIRAESEGLGHGTRFRFTLAGITRAAGKDKPR